jgi:hypothetical protein
MGRNIYNWGVSYEFRGLGGASWEITDICIYPKPFRIPVD